MSNPVCTLNPNVYTIEGVQRIGANLVLKVRYPGCDGCAAEGVKILVFLNVTETEALMWKRIYPYHQITRLKRPSTEAPNPGRHFTGTPQGWQSAVEYALDAHLKQLRLTGAL